MGYSRLIFTQFHNTVFLLLVEQNYFKAVGGALLDNHKVVHIEPGERVTLTTSQGTVVHAKKVVLTPGGWGRNMLTQLGLKNLPLQVL